MTTPTTTSALVQDKAEWMPFVRATAVCLVALLAALAVESFFPLVAVCLYAVSFVAGMRYTLPEAAQALARWKVDVDFLMLLVALGAWQLGHPAEGASLLVLFNGSRAMESYARRRTRSSIEELARDLPRKATRLRDGNREEIALGEVVVGDVLVVKPGERVPVDCKLVDGTTTLDLSPITGESELQKATPGTEIPSGAVNGESLIEVRALRLASESAYQKIITLIENAPQRRSPAQVLSDRIGERFTLVILSVSAIGFVGWWQIGELSMAEAGYRAMVLLVAGSPCAIVLSIPSAILAAIASGARRGVLFNGGLGLGALATLKLAAFDKTGTLSTGVPGVMKITGDGAEDPEILAVARELAESSTHPASKSIARYFKEQWEGKLPAVTLDDISERPGRGMGAQWGTMRVELGRPRGCDALDEEDPEFSRTILCADGKPRLRFFLSETPRPQAAETMAELHKRGIRTMMISGDVRAAVERMAKSVGIDDARAELKPEQKWQIIQDEAARQPTMMVGDGVNDAPALAAATVGVAMGVRGSAATLAQADIILVKDRLDDLIAALDLAQRTRRVINQNLAIAIGAASIMITLAIVGILPLILGVFGHEGGTVLVVLNSLRLLVGSDRPHAVRDAGVRPAALAVAPR